MKTNQLRLLLLGAFALFIGCWTAANADARITIATFNIQNFGPKKSSDKPTLAVLAAIIRKYDVVAVQEISDVSGKAPQLLLTAINHGPGDDYAMALSPRRPSEQRRLLAGAVRLLLQHADDQENCPRSPLP